MNLVAAAQLQPPGTAQPPRQHMNTPWRTTRPISRRCRCTATLAPEQKANGEALARTREDWTLTICILLLQAVPPRGQQAATDLNRSTLQHAVEAHPSNSAPGLLARQLLDDGGPNRRWLLSG